MRIFILILICFLVPCTQGYNLDFFKRFNDEYLENYIFEALNNNHELKEANYKLEQFQQQVKMQFANQLPQASIGANYLGAHFPFNDNNNFFIKQNSFIVPLQASYEPDFLLKNFDKTKSAQKLYKAQRANREGVYITLLSNVATTYMNIILTDYLIEKEKEIIENKTYNLKYNDRKYYYGIIDSIEFNNFQKDLFAEKLIYENLIKTQNSNLYKFSTLIGQSASCADEIQRGKLQDFEYQQTIPEIINSDLIYLRPDMVEIENKLKSAKIDITIAKKEFFPKFNLTGLLAFDTAGAGNFFAWGSSFALLVAGATLDLFKGGEKIANLKYKKARYSELLEQYFQKDLKAIEEINNALNQIKQDKKSENISKNQLNIETKNFNATRKKLKQGTASKIDYFDDKTRMNEKEQILAFAKISRLIDYLSLYKAVGGQL